MYLAAALVATEPAVVQGWSSFLAAGAAGHGKATPGNHLQTDYRLWLAGHQLEHGRAPWIDPYSFRPEAEPQPNPAWWPFGLLYWPLTAAFGQVSAWNLFTLLSLAAAGGVTFGWLRTLGLARAAALVGGIAFAVAPYRLAQSRGHLLGPISLLLPLVLWAFERALAASRSRGGPGAARHTWRRGRGWWWLSSAALVSIPLSGQVHLALGAIPFLVLYAVCRSRERRVLVEAGSAAVAAILAGILIRLTVIAGSIGAGGRSLNEVGAFSADGLDFLSRTARHGSETFVFLGWATPFVALAGLVLLLRRGSFALAAALGLGTVVPALLALGTKTPLYTGLWHALPPFRYPRAPERLMPIACLTLAALVAFALEALLRRPEARRVPVLAVGAAAVTLVLADLHVRVFRPSAADTANAAYAAIRAQPPGRLLELPVFTPDLHHGSVYLFYEQQVRRQRPAGYSTTAPRVADEVTRTLRPLDCGDWTTGAGRALRELGITVLTLHRGLYLDNEFVPDTAWFAWRGLIAHGWRPLAADGAITAFGPGRSEKPPPFAEPTRDEARFCGSWRPGDDRGRQMRREHAALWVHGAGILRLFLASPRRVSLRLSVDGRFHSRRVVSTLEEARIGLAGDHWHLVALDLDRLPVVGGRKRGVRIVAYALPDG